MSDALREAEMLAFEAWMRSDGTLPLDRDSFDYADFHVALMWHAWEAARSALTAPPAPAVPAGWRLVPVEPTPEMIAAMAVIDSSGTCNGTPTVGMAGADEAYAAMLAAAPQPAPQPTQED